MSDEKALIQKKALADSLRRTAAIGVLMSTVAVLICIVLVPTIYSHIQQVHSFMISEVDFCKSRSSNIWQEVTKTQVTYTPYTINWLFFRSLFLVCKSDSTIDTSFVVQENSK